MGPVEIFLIRLFVSVLFAILSQRVFFGKVTIWGVIGLAGMMLGLAYLLASMRRRDKEQGS